MKKWSNPELLQLTIQNTFTSVDSYDNPNWCQSCYDATSNRHNHSAWTGQNVNNSGKVCSCCDAISIS